MVVDEYVCSLLRWCDGKREGRVLLFSMDLLLKGDGENGKGEGDAVGTS